MHLPTPVGTFFLMVHHQARSPAAQLLDFDLRPSRHPHVIGPKFSLPPLYHAAGLVQFLVDGISAQLHAKRDENNTDSETDVLR